jgi:hypothetical protein
MPCCSVGERFNKTLYFYKTKLGYFYRRPVNGRDGGFFFYADLK